VWDPQHAELLTDVKSMADNFNNIFHMHPVPGRGREDFDSYNRLSLSCAELHEQFV
jgi:hypothetical protein